MCAPDNDAVTLTERHMADMLGEAREQREDSFRVRMALDPVRQRLTPAEAREVAQLVGDAGERSRREELIMLASTLLLKVNQLHLAGLDEDVIVEVRASGGAR